MNQVKAKKIIDININIQKIIFEAIQTGQEELNDEQKEKIFTLYDETGKGEFFETTILDSKNLDRGSNCLMEFFSPSDALMNIADDLTEEVYDELAVYCDESFIKYWEV